MDKKIIEQAKGKTREERAKLLSDFKTSLSDDALAGVNGGVAEGVENPNSEQNSYKGNWWTSLGYVCDGARVC